MTWNGYLLSQKPIGSDREQGSSDSNPFPHGAISLTPRRILFKVQASTVTGLSHIYPYACHLVSGQQVAPIPCYQFSQQIYKDGVTVQSSSDFQKKQRCH
ncbi:hypothetical protein STEG23_026710 [Scotinomys teguina]